MRIAPKTGTSHTIPRWTSLCFGVGTDDRNNSTVTATLRARTIAVRNEYIMGIHIRSSHHTTNSARWGHERCQLVPPKFHTAVYQLGPSSASATAAVALRRLATEHRISV